MEHYDLETINYNNGRFYKTPNGIFLPSVTTVIGHSSDKTWLQEWRANVGDETADRISTLSANRGTIMHQMLEYYLSSLNLKESLLKLNNFVKTQGFTDLEYKIGLDLFWNIYHCGFFKRIKKVIALEIPLFATYNGGYAGRCDCIYLNHDDKIIFLDFKTSKKLKTVNQIIDYYLQLPAYLLAYYQRTGIKAHGAEIWMAMEKEESAEIFQMSIGDIKKYSKEFLKLVKIYHNDFNIEIRKLNN